MAAQDQRDESADEPDLVGGQPPGASVKARNTVDGSTVSKLVQAHTINDGVHFHDHLAPPPRPVPQQLPPAPRGFVGRVDHLADLDIPAGGPEKLSMVVISAIGGTGGIGKTWLALTWAHRNLDRFPDGQLFVDLHGFSPTARPAHPVDVLGGFLDALGVDRDRQPIDPDRRADLYRSLIADKQMLVVLDNAASTDQVNPLLPGGHQCTVPITSRNHMLGLIARHGARPVHLDMLTDTEARTLLTAALGPDKAVAEAQAIKELIRLCGGFPLALGLITARVAANPRLPLGDTVGELRVLGLDALDSDDPTASLPTVLSWSLRYLTDEQREAFALLGIAPGPNIGLPAASTLTGMSERETYVVLRGLADASLVSRTSGGRHGVHDLVRAYAASAAEDLPTSVRETALRRVIDFYIHTAFSAKLLLDPDGGRYELDSLTADIRPHPLPDAAGALAWFDTEHACLLAAQHFATTHVWHRSVWNLARGLYTFHLRRGHRHDHLIMWQAALDAATHLPNPVARIVALRCLGAAYTDLGQHEDALTHLHQALALAEHHHAPVQQAMVQYSLGRAWEQRKNNRRAMEHARRALDLFSSLDQPVWEATALNAIGWHAAHLGDYDTARDRCRAALDLLRHHHSSDAEAAVLDSLGYIDHHSGYHSDSVDHYHHALTLCRQLGNTYEIATTLDGLGHPHAALGQHKQARSVWQEALQLYQQQGRDGDPSPQNDATED